jgi:hypothetical protein
MKFYISGGALWLLLIFYTPVVLFLLWWLWRKLPKRLPIRIGVSLVALIIAAAIPLGDVMITSVQMAKLCPQAGVTINRTVNADGFYTNIGGSDHLKRGFKYVEVKSGNVVKIYTESDDAIQIQEINTEKNAYVPKSRYEFIFRSTDVPAGYLHIDRDRSIARDRETAEELGFTIRYTAYAGWVDRNTIARLGQVLWSCPSDQYQEAEFMTQVISPNK